MVGATNGWHDGFQYFPCEPGKGMFLRLGALKRDDQLSDVKGPSVVTHNREYSRVHTYVCR